MHLFVGARWQRIAAVCSIIFLVHPPAAKGQAENDVRLVDGPNANEGRVEISKSGVWLSVCRSYVSNEFASVACRQLNYSGNGAVMYYANSYGAAPGEILRENINCYKYGVSLSNLSQCVFSPLQQNCNPSYTLGLSCDTGVSEVPPVRLVNGTSPYEGRVEVFKSGVWGTVTDRDSYSNRPFYNNLAANILCKALFGPRYDGSVVPKQEATLRYGVAKRRAIVMSNIQCKGSDQFLPNCSYSSVSVSETLEDSLAVICKQAENDVRLVDGPSANEGRVEIFNGGNWSSVCRSYVSSDFGSVACRQLNYSGNGAVMYYTNSYGAAPGEILRQNIDCYGYGAPLSYLSQCVFTPHQQNCGASYTLGLSCDTGVSEVQPVRLVNGTSPYEGRVEVFKSGVWGTVTDRDGYYNSRPLYNTIVANIVCKALFGPSYGGSFVPKPEATERYGVAQRRAIVMRNITCNGNERFPQNCSYSSASVYETLEDSLAVICKQVPEGCNAYIAESNGTLQSPGYPEGVIYSNDTDCLWKIVNAAGGIELNFTDLQVNTTFSPAESTLQVLDSFPWSTLAFISNTTTPGTLLSWGSALYLWLKAESGTTGIRFQASWGSYTPPEPPPCPETTYGSSGYLQSPRYPDQYQPNLNCTYPITKRRGVLINFVFYNFALGEAEEEVCQDYLQIFDGDSEMSPTVGGPLCGTTRPAAIRTKIVNSTKVLVRFKTDAVNTSVERGFNIYYSQVDPDPIRPGNYTEDSGSFKSPGYPDVYNDEEDIIWTITTKPYKTITLSFKDVKIGPCCSNRIQVLDPIFGRSNYIYSSGSVSPISSDGNILEIKFVSILDNGGNKVKASWTTECRQVFQSSKGTITSPNDADFYSSPAECTYVINTQQPGYYLTIEFSAISFEKDDKCTNYIQIYNGSTEFFPSVKYCAQSLPLPLNSSQTQVFIKFSSKIGYNNFSLTYSSHPKVCDKGLMTDNEGSFTSPGFPLGYPSNTYCVWTIIADDKEAILELTFDDFSVGFQGTQCQYAFVRVYDGPVVEASTVVATLCGTTLPPKIRSTGNSMTVVLNVFGSLVNANGFRASYIGRKATGCLKGLYPYGPDANDGKLGSSLYEEQEVPIENGFPYGEDLHSAVKVGANGVLTFDKGRAWPRLDSSRRMVCAYCTYINTQQGVYYHLYQNTTSDRDVLEKATCDVRDFTGSKTFNAKAVLAVTWDRVTQYFPSVDYKPTNMGDATFQTALVTDGTESYALVQYRVGHMTWRYPGRWYTIEMGVAKGYLTTFRPNVYSGTEIAYEMDNYFGNTGYKGYWVYELGKIPNSYKKVCRDWITKNKKRNDKRSAGFSALPRCPCSRRGIFRGVVNQWRFHRRDEQNHLECYILNVARTGQFQPFGKECCYWTDLRNEDTLDMLVTTPPFAGASLAFNPLVFAQEKLYDKKDRIPHVACCEHGDAKQCKWFYKLRPIGKCDPNPAGQWSSMYGDPHITTFDERQYILNGLGEFTLVSLITANVSFTLQARTERAELRVGVPTNGSVFTAIGAEENGARVFVQVDPNTNTTLIVYAKGIDYTGRFLQEGDNFVVDEESVMLRRDNDSCLVNFPSGISLQLSIRMKALIIGISMPREFRGLTKGLLGNFNGDQEDDFVLPSGERLNNNLSERQILDMFASKWRVGTNNTVMRYERRMGPADYNRLDFVPLFLDEVEPSKLTQAKVLCGDTNLPCIYDFLATGDRNFAFQTSDLRNLSDILIQQSKNTAPVVVVPDAIYVTVGTPVVVAVTGVDPDVNDTLTFYLVDNANGALSIIPSSGEMTINLTSLTPIKIQVFAVDSHDAQSPVESVPIVACSGCSGHGTCNMSDTRDEMGDYEFQYAVCLCGPAWAADNCELDKDGCSDNPCHPLQNCTDIPASQQGTSDIGYICSACPRGYFMKNGSRDCYDVDECSNSTLHGCTMLCDNTYGSYECSCQDGYRLSTDGHSCNDVNECVEKTDDCQQICNNTAGGFQCQCEAGYSLDNNQKSCVLNPDVSEICRNSNCSQGCRVIADSENNSFPQCFCYQGFDLDARDNRTCVDRDECRDRVCDQVCNNMAGGFSCSCYSGYTLNKDQRTCSPCSYLKYGPECRETCTCSGRSAECHPVKGCICQDGWTGSTCTDDVDECAENPDVCGLNQLCANTKGSYSCICRSGYTLDDSGVCQDIDECTTDFPCKQSEECTNIPGTFYCNCKQGYTSVESNCTDINECAINRGDCQQDCVNVPGSFNCECKYGYRLNADRKTCSQVLDVCANAAKCSTAQGCTLDDNNNDLCFCDTGYTFNQNTHSCEDIDECATGLTNCSNSCTNTPGSFVCSCPAGMKLDNNGLTCSTCFPGTFGANCSQVCACAAGAESCDPVSGCMCRQGWEGDKCDKDVDECQSATLPPNCTGQNGECVNTYGGYQCKCRKGFATDNNSVCQDIDECLEAVCDQRCENTIGSFHCSCDEGFYWDADAQICADVDECAALETNGCQQRCENTAGSYRCSCTAEGYILNNDGLTCASPFFCQRTDCDSVNGGCAVGKDGETCFCNNGYYMHADGVSCRSSSETTTAVPSALVTNSPTQAIATTTSAQIPDNDDDLSTDDHSGADARTSWLLSTTAVYLAAVAMSLLVTHW